MIRIIDGKPVEIPDDERITEDMKLMRTLLNDFLMKISADTPENRRLAEQYREGRIGESGIDWYMDPDIT